MISFISGMPNWSYEKDPTDVKLYSHALQLRQAKLSFPSVYLLAGVNSDEQVFSHKSRTIMTHAER